MAIVQTNSAGISTASAANNVSWNTAATAGNLLLIIVIADDYVTSGNRPSGFTQSTGCGQEGYVGHYLWWKVATGGETSATYTLTSSVVSSWLTAEISGLSGSPYDISDGQHVDTGATTYTTPSIIPTSGSRYLIASMAGAHYSSAGVGRTHDTWLNSFTEQDDETTVSEGATQEFAAWADRSVTGDGSTGFSSGATYSGSGADARSGIIISFIVGGATASGSIRRALLGVG